MQLKADPSILHSTDALAIFREALVVELTNAVVRRPAVFVSTNRYIAPAANVGGGNPLSEDDLNAFAVFFAHRAETLEWKPHISRVIAAFAEITDGLVLSTHASPQSWTQRTFYVQEPTGNPTPLESCGDGLRDLVMILAKVAFHTLEDLLIDEPGLRLHPHAQRRLLKHLSDASLHRSIWIATHDAVFLNSPLVTTRYAVTRTGGTSVVSVIPGESEARRVLLGIGWRPQDACLAEHVLYCEGAADKLIFGALVSRLGNENPDMSGAVVEALGGDGQFRSGTKLPTRLIEAVTLMGAIAPHAVHVAVLDKASDGDPERPELKAQLENVGVRLRVLVLTELEDYFLGARPSIAHARAELSRARD